MKSFATVSLITLVASAAAGEIAARALHLAPAVAPIRLGEESSAYRRSDDPLLGYVLKEGFRDRHPTNIDTFDRTNSDGFRDVERSIAKPPGTTRILLLGDSVVVGNGLPGIEQTIPACLERRLRDRRVEVLNFGQGGYCTLSEVELLRVKGLRYQPDLVAVVFVNNDYEGALWAANRYGWKRPPGVNALFLQSYFFRFLCLRFDLFHFREVLGNPVAAINAAIGADNVDDGLRMLRALADERRFKPLIFVWPTFGEKAIEELGHPAGDRSVFALAKKYGIPTYSLAPRFEEEYRRYCAEWAPFKACESPRRLYTTAGDGMHAAPEGAELAARIMESVLIENGLVPSGK